jgi:Patatin-like phospholipase
MKSSMAPTAERDRIRRTTAVALILAGLAFLAGGIYAYASLAPDVPNLIKIELGIARPADATTLQNTLWPDAALIVGYGVALILLGYLARAMAWTETSRNLALFGIGCAVIAMVADGLEDVCLALGDRADWCYSAAAGASAVKWSALVPAALTALTGLVLSIARLFGNRPRRLTDVEHSLQPDDCLAPPSLEPPPPQNVRAVTDRTALRSRRWRNAYVVPEWSPASAVGNAPLAVCVSGGGVRSASVALGALQALRPVIKRADYIISVSGGGYTAGALVQALTRGGSNNPNNDGIDRNVDDVLAPGSILEDHLRRHSSYLASTPARLMLALALIARGLLGSLFVIFSAAIAIGVLVGVFYNEIPISPLSKVTVPSQGITVSYPVPRAPGLWAVVVIAGFAALSWTVAVIIAGWRPWSSRWCQVPIDIAQAACLLVTVVVSFVILIPALTFACCWLYVRAGHSTTINISVPILTVLLSYLAAIKSVFWKDRKKLALFASSVGSQSKGLAAKAPQSMLQLLLTAVVLVLLSAVWLIMFGVAASTQSDSTALWIALGISLGWLFVGGLVDEPALSLHPFYRARLASAFAVRIRDGVAVPYKSTELTSLPAYGQVDSQDWGTIPPRFVFAAAANLVDDDRTAPGLRAVSYVMTSDYIGGPDIGWVPTDQAIRACPPHLRHDLTVQAAVAISGAAFASAMGRASSWYGTLLAVSGARLGSWLPHPDYLLLRREMAEARDWTLPGMPHVRRFSYLLRELLGIHPYFQRLLNVTDGGHYENLGLVEALRRRCRTIYVIDATGDSPPTATTFGEALRLAHDELGVVITPNDPLNLEPGSAKPFEPSVELAALNARLSKDGVIIANIQYPAESDLPPHKRIGTLILAKASLWPELPYEVLSYAAKHSLFPHDSTADQFFDEGSFSSYKRLGYSLGTSAATAEYLLHRSKLERCIEYVRIGPKQGSRKHRMMT